MKSITKQDKTIFLITFLAGILVHGYALVNKITNHDDMPNLIGCGDGLAFGRWMWKVWADLQIMNTPFLYGIFNIVLMTLCAVILVRLYSIKKIWVGALIGCIWISFPANISLFFYNQLIPIYSIGIFLSVLAIYVYISQNSVKKYVISIVCIMVSMGCYQAYLSVTVVGIVLYLLLKFYRTKMHWKAIMQDCSSALFTLVAGIISYFAITKVICNYYNVVLSEYQDMDNIGGNFLQKLPDMVSLAYSTFFTFHSGIQNTFFAKVQDIVLPVTFFIFGAILIYKHIRKNNRFEALCSFIIIALYPAICNLTYFYGSDFVYSLMQYSNAFLHIAVLCLLDELVEFTFKPQKYVKIVTMFIGIVATMGFAQNLMLANREYYAQQRAQIIAFDYLSGVVSRIQSTTGYKQGMPIALIGYCSDQNIKALDATSKRANLGSTTTVENFVNSIIYHDWLRPGTLQNWVGFADTVLSAEQSRIMLNDPRVSQMPNYPSEGSVQVVDDIMVVHFSSFF